MVNERIVRGIKASLAYVMERTLGELSGSREFAAGTASPVDVAEASAWLAMQRKDSVLLTFTRAEVRAIARAATRGAENDGKDLFRNAAERRLFWKTLDNLKASVEKS